jgi:hypothetical protein
MKLKIVGSLPEKSDFVEPMVQAFFTCMYVITTISKILRIQ